MKQCIKCNIDKDLNQFYKRKNGNALSKCIICHSVYTQNYKAKHKLEEKERNKICYLNNIDKYKTISQEYKAKHKLEEKERNKIWLQKNKQKINKRYHSDLDFKIKLSLRNRLNQAIRQNYKFSSAVSDLGCTISELKLHLENQFKLGMTWENWSRDGWHIDHIKPFDAFDLSDPSQQSLACHYTNLQPLWAKDNLSKGAKYE